ncbi:MAG: helix-turn-helix domain-containing protein [Desulfobacterales bacterium]
MTEIALKYGHFCPIALALEKIGDKWSLLIVRDLLQKPRRFTDLMLSLGKITPRWLTLRLRELEADGIVERDSRKGRREVWYRLTPVGKELLPVMETLLNWGLRHAMRPPMPGEVVNPELMLRGMARFLNAKAKRLSGSRQWCMAFPQGAFTMTFDGKQWSMSEGSPRHPDVVIETTPETWAKISTVSRAERQRLLNAVHLVGNPDRIEEFKDVFGLTPKKSSHKKPNPLQKRNEK